MKKILLMAVAAIALMACNSNNAEMPANDKKAMNAATVQALAQIGQSTATVEKSLLDAGFVKAEVPASAPKRMKQFNKLQAPAAATQAYYVYNIEAADLDLEDDAMAAKQNAILKKGKAIIIAVAVYSDDKLAMLTTTAIVAAKKGANKNYVTVSDGLYQQIPSDALAVQWQGTIDEKEYKDQADYAAAIAAAEESAMTANEVEIVIKGISTFGGYEGFGYMGMFTFPTEKEIADQAKEGCDPYAAIVYAVADIAAMM